MNSKAVAVLGVLAVVGAAAAYFATRSGTSESGDSPTSGASGAGKPGALVYPELGTRAADVAEIHVKRAAQEFTIKKDGETWKVVEKANYPAKVDSVRGVVVGISQLIAVEPKTSRADQYSKLGVDDPIAPPPDAANKDLPQSSLVTLKDSSGKAIASVIIGNPKYGGQSASGATAAELYIRKAGEPQSWLVSGQVEVPREPTGWLEATFADIKRDRIKSVVVTHPDSSTVTVARGSQAEAFNVQGIPVGRELKDPGVGESIAGAMTGLSFQDVAAAAMADTSQMAAGVDIKPGPSIVLRTFDGLIVTAQTASKEAKAWWTLVASADEALAVPPPAPTAPAADGTAPTTPAAPAAGTAEAIKKEVADLNAKWSPYAFAPVDWKVRSMNTTLADMLKEPAPAAPAIPDPTPHEPDASVPFPIPNQPVPAP